MRDAKLEPDVISYSAGISACTKREQWQRALALLGEMRGAKLEPDVSATTLGSVLARRVCSGSGLWHCSARCGRRSWSQPSSATALGSVRAKRAEQWQRAMALLSEMWEAKLQTNSATTLG
ncbi:unnamed protein product [Prorocentrum cordatum]|uniref:Uncharacterized protein n=1 Tax=Prorocentrum cordatum TaxID=2364126 RepID=A0ABN9UH69_9DINO|nr:unnamed protein product [Polarella glacialis]